MWRFTRKLDPEPARPAPEPAEPGVLERILDHELRIRTLETAVRAFGLEMEDFTAQVSRAARRAYKRDQDTMRASEGVEAGPPPLTPVQRRLAAKLELRRRRTGEP